jgi:hypothetical protein
VSGELEWLYKEAVVAYSSYYFGISPEGLEKTMEASVRMTCFQIEIRSEHLMETTQELYLYTKQFGGIMANLYQTSRNPPPPPKSINLQIRRREVLILMT